MSELNRLYGLLEERIGFTRKRDSRLEKIAADRALEARYQVGLSGTTPITHPVNQLKARTFPLQGTYKGVYENATWNYGYADPVQQAADNWWNSDPHRYNFQRPEATAWGLGIYTESGRWYFIAVLTRDLMTPAIVTSGTDFPDALGAGPLASRLGAPLLLTFPTTLPKATRDRLTALQPSEILVIGGPGAVSESVVTALSAIAPVRRIFGADRFATAVEVSRA